MEVSEAGEGHGVNSLFGLEKACAFRATCFFEQVVMGDSQSPRRKTLKESA